MRAPWIVLGILVVVGLAIWYKRKAARKDGAIPSGPPGLASKPLPATPSPATGNSIKTTLDGFGDVFRAATGVRETGIKGVIGFFGG